MKKAIIVLVSVMALFALVSCAEAEHFEANVTTTEELNEALSALSSATEAVELRLANGTYNVQVNVPAGKTLTIIGESEDGVVIAGPEDYTAMASLDIYDTDNGSGTFNGYVGLVQAKDATLTLRNLTIKGDEEKNHLMTTQSGKYCRQGGLMVINSEIDAVNVSITDTIYTESQTGVQNGIAIYIVGEGAGKKAEFDNCTITNFNKGALVARSSVSELVFRNGTVKGLGATELTAQNGIQFSCKATITGNHFSDMKYVKDDAYKGAATAIYNYNAPADSVVVEGNTFENVDIKYNLDEVEQ